MGLQSDFANNHNKDDPHALGCVPPFPVAAKAPLGLGCPSISRCECGSTLTSGQDLSGCHV